MEKVVYILGAGFSAPLGLPVMSNFLIKSKDAFAQNPEKYAHFKQVFDTIKDMHACKSYFQADLFNIEEILSILEMREGLRETSTARSFTKYIEEVIEHYTPRQPEPDLLPAKSDFSNRVHAWENCIFGADSWCYYASFVASLFGLQAKLDWTSSSTAGRVQFDRYEKPLTEYAVITLNYDSVLEDVCSYINRHFPSPAQIQFQRDPEWSGDDQTIHISLAKLHGSVGTERIVAPTWNKYLHPQIVSNWKMAHDLIANANHLRILGYSLPTGDAYIKYLLKSAISQCANMKTLDVLCLGPKAKSNYDDFITFNYYRYNDCDIKNYLYDIRQASMTMKTNAYSTQLVFNKLESIHEAFMKM